ncbi:MAG: phosphoribosylformylglycinamidine cyclo-ligase [Ignavibacteria bacterium]|nr:phosphoribosylformylglycinamidine cyclo-ligase [Ignavibacteria bacterium]
MKTTYSAAGVSISEGDKFVDSIKPMVKSTFNSGVLSGIGNFGAFFKVPKGMKDPVFVASTDGVGTKLKVAISAGKHDTIGEDLVNHCVNDIAVCGAKPLFFLDYMAFGRLKANTAKDIVKGLVRGCKSNSCALIGGETAEMPGMYAKDDYDVAGTIIGVVEKSKIIDKKNVRSGDVMIAFPSNGLHTNGYSLARSVLIKKHGLNRQIASLRGNLKKELLKVHRSYLSVIQLVTKTWKVHSISHITGGGILGNTKRVVPKGFKINVDWNTWTPNPIFKLIQETGNISDLEMRKVFNMGIGLIMIVSRKDVIGISAALTKAGEKFYIIGNITE